MSVARRKRLMVGPVPTSHDKMRTKPTFGP